MNLTELQKADPDLVADIAADLAYFDGHILFGKEKIPEFEERIEQAIIQAGIQRAIERRGWDWALHYIGSYYAKWTAFIQPVMAIGAGDSAASAFLAAYTEALHD